MVEIDHQNISLERVLVGEEETPVLIIDGVLKSLDAPREEAVQEGYSDDPERIGVFYPGVRADVGADYGMALLKFAQKLCHEHLDVPLGLTLYPIAGSYSLLTQAGEQLRGLQSIPHFDSYELLAFAMLHYLNDGDFSGTAFYKHKSTGFETITESRKQLYLDALETEGHRHRNGLGYISDSNPYFERIYTVDYVPNRLVLYPSCLLHTAHVIKPENDIDACPATGRLSGNFFLRFDR